MKSLFLIAIIVSSAIASSQPNTRNTGCDLIYALENNNETEAIRLIEDGVDANVTSSYLRFPLHIAASRGFEKVIRLLIQKGYKNQIHGRDINRNSPLNVAARTDRDSIVDLLIKNGCDINDINDSQVLNTYNPLRSAAENGNLKMVKLLVENGANVHSTNWWGQTARDFAEDSKHWRVVDYLEEVGNKTVSNDFPKTVCPEQAV